MFVDVPCELADAVDEHLEDILDDPISWMTKLRLSQEQMVSLIVVGKQKKRKRDVVEDCDSECG